MRCRLQRRTDGGLFYGFYLGAPADASSSRTENDDLPSRPLPRLSLFPSSLFPLSPSSPRPEYGTSGRLILPDSQHLLCRCQCDSSQETRNEQHGQHHLRAMRALRPCHAQVTSLHELVGTNHVAKVARLRIAQSPSYIRSRRHRLSTLAKLCHIQLQENRGRNSLAADHRQMQREAWGGFLSTPLCDMRLRPIGDGYTAFSRNHVDHGSGGGGDVLISNRPPPLPPTSFSHPP